MTIRKRTEFGPSTVYEQAEDAVEAALGCEWEFKVPTNVILQFERTEGRKHHPFRLKVTWTAVTQNVANEAVDVDGYTVQIQYSPDGTTWTDTKRTKVIRDKDANNDGVDDPGPPTVAIFHNIKPKKYYRARVRAVGPGGFCKSAFSQWTGAFSATDSVAPSAPLNVDIELDNHRLILTWDHPDDSGLGVAATEDVDIADNIAYYQWQVTNNNANWTSSATYWKKGRTVGDRRTLKVQKPSGTYYARVRSWDAAGNKSDWVTDNTSKTALSAPTVSTPTSELGTNDKYKRVNVTLTGVTAAEDVDYIVQLALGSTSGKKLRQRIEGDESPLVATFRHIPAGETVYARARTISYDGDRSAWSGWTGSHSLSVTTATPSTYVSVTRHSRRKYYLQWDLNSDPQIDQYIVEWAYRWKTLPSGTYTAWSGWDLVTRTKASHVNFDVPAGLRSTKTARFQYKFRVRFLYFDYTESAAPSATYEYSSADTDPTDTISDEIGYDAGTISAGTFQGVKFTTNDGNDTVYIEIDGASTKDKVQFITNTGTTNLVATSGGVQIGGASSQKVGFYGATPVDQRNALADVTPPSNPSAWQTDVTDTINGILLRLRNLGLFAS